MSQQRVTLWSLWLSLVLALAAGCRRPGNALAHLAAMAGPVDRDHSSQLGAFSTARVGEEFFVGDGIRTGGAGHAELSLVEGSTLILEERTLIRFATRAPGDQGQRFDLELGQAVLSAGGAALTISTSFGEAVIQPNTSLRLTRSATGARFEVTFGSAILNRGGKNEELVAGKPLELGVMPAASARLGGTAPLASALAPAAVMPPREGSVSVEVTGDGARVRYPGRSDFQPFGPGSSGVPEGSRLDLPSGSSALLKSKEGGVRLVGPGTFGLGKEGDSSVQTETGTLDLAPQSGTVTVSVPGGSIRVAAGSRASLRTERSGTRLSVAQGSLTVEATKAKETLHGGEEAMLSRSGTLKRLRSHGLEYADLVVAAGESFVVHDPRPPSVVGLRVGSQCENSVLVELTGQNKAELIGEKSVNLPLKPGHHPYLVRCLTTDGRPSKQVARGSISVTADAGTRRLPTRAPSSVIEADGRNYTVLFQNQLPSLTVRWPGATGSGPFVLSIKPPRGPLQTVSTALPQYTFAPGKLVEGLHQFAFEGGGARTKPTVVDIRFDNATPAASIESPADGSFGPGAQVRVAGTSLPGSSVSVSGVALLQDDQHRFGGDVVAPTSQRALAIRFEHPQRGTHYYLRRISGAMR